MHRPGKFRLFVLGLLAVLPSFLKRPCYRLFFGYRIGKRVRIGLSIVEAWDCEIGDDTKIGHLNLIIGVQKLTLGDHVRIGHLNIIRGGEEVSLGRYTELLRLNEINSIPEPDVVNAIDSRFLLGPGSIITTGHKIDFTDRVTIGGRTIIGGHNSSLWTHNRQRTRPISVGDSDSLITAEGAGVMVRDFNEAHCTKAANAVGAWANLRRKLAHKCAKSRNDYSMSSALARNPTRLYRKVLAVD